MHILIFVLPDASEKAVVSGRAKSLRQYIATCERNGWTWRYHDGSGWAKGSVNAWREIETITGTRDTTIVY